MKDALLVLDAEGLVAIANPAACQLLGRPRGELVGRGLPGLAPALVREEEIRDVLRGESREPAERHWVRADGQLVHVEISLSAIRSHVSRSLGVVCLARDISRRKADEEREREMAATTAAIEATERRAEELERANEEIRRKTEELQQFADVASHDLREPLRKVASFAQLLDRRYRGRLDPGADEYLRYITDGVQRMDAMIGGLLLCSRLSREEIVLESVSLEDALRRVLGDLEVMIRESGAVITSDPLPPVRGDTAQIERLFQNVISNAIKFRGDEPPRIHVGARRQGSDWLFSVQDNGIGIAPEHRERVFAIFHRLHPPSRYDGTGIGLAIARRILDRLGGRIWVEPAPGGGSVFCFTIPVAGVETGAMQGLDRVTPGIGS